MNPLVDLVFWWFYYVQRLQQSTGEMTLLMVFQICEVGPKWQLSFLSSGLAMTELGCTQLCHFLLWISLHTQFSSFLPLCGQQWYQGIRRKNLDCLFFASCKKSKNTVKNVGAVFFLNKCYFFSLVYLFSVFNQLSEDACLFWDLTVCVLKTFFGVEKQT